MIRLQARVKSNYLKHGVEISSCFFLYWSKNMVIFLRFICYYDQKRSLCLEDSDLSIQDYLRN